jgi:hypothetical protein
MNTRELLLLPIFPEIDAPECLLWMMVSKLKTAQWLPLDLSPEGNRA